MPRRLPSIVVVSLSVVWCLISAAPAVGAQAITGLHLWNGGRFRWCRAFRGHCNSNQPTAHQGPGERDDWRARRLPGSHLPPGTYSVTFELRDFRP